MFENFNDWNRWLHSVVQSVEFRRSTENPATHVSWYTSNLIIPSDWKLQCQYQIACLYGYVTFRVPLPTFRFSPMTVPPYCWNQMILRWSRYISDLKSQDELKLLQVDNLMLNNALPCFTTFTLRQNDTLSD